MNLNILMAKLRCFSFPYWHYCFVDVASLEIVPHIELLLHDNIFKPGRTSVLACCIQTLVICGIGEKSVNKTEMIKTKIRKNAYMSLFFGVSHKQLVEFTLNIHEESDSVAYVCWLQKRWFFYWNLNETTLFSLSLFRYTKELKIHKISAVVLCSVARINHTNFAPKSLQWS